MKRVYKIFFLPLISVIIIFYSCSEDALVLPPTPIADAGDDQLVEAFDTVFLSGSLGKISNDAEYIWSFDYKPEGSNSFFSDSSSSSPYFIADIEGFYNVQLVVRVGESYSEPNYILIQCVYRKSKQYFPNSVGSKWIYKNLNSANEKDTLTFQIVGEATLEGNEQATIWICDINTHSYFYILFDTLYFERTDDTLIFKKYWGNNWELIAIYIVPFIVGNTWYDGGCHYSVQEESTLQTAIGTFTHAFKIKESRLGGEPNSGLTTYSWIVPYIGLVKRDIYEFYLVYPLHEEHWELSWYHLTE